MTPFDRRAAIRKAYIAGDSYSMIAERFGITKQRVYQILTSNKHYPESKEAQLALARLGFAIAIAALAQGARLDRTDEVTS